MESVDKMLEGDLQCLSNLISLVERDSPEVPKIMKEIHPYLGKAHVVGITGPTGVGKSTLVARLTQVGCRKGLSVGIVAVDPTSGFSGGAVLGDRIRMQQHYLNPQVFIRSMATRGSRGGLTWTLPSVIKLLDAFGKHLILVETAGVGQVDLDVRWISDTTMVLFSPGGGDAIQAIKAGLTEIADILVINKADRQEADELRLDLEFMLSLSPRKSQWVPPIILAQASHVIGIEEVYDTMEKHYQYLQTSGELVGRRRERRHGELLLWVEERLRHRLWESLRRNNELMSLIEKVENGEVAPQAAVDIIENAVFFSD